jgi:hypothetical protein
LGSLRSSSHNAKDDASQHNETARKKFFHCHQIEPGDLH